MRREDALDVSRIESLDEVDTRGTRRLLGDADLRAPMGCLSDASNEQDWGRRVAKREGTGRVMLLPRLALRAAALPTPSERLMPSSRSSRRVLFATIPLLVSLACATSPSATPLSSAGSIDGSARTTVVGPERGSLVIAGGGALGPEIIERFISLAGGPDARIVVIPTAGGADSYAPDWNGLALLRNAGATRLTVLHTNSRREADA